MDSTNHPPRPDPSDPAPVHSDLQDPAPLLFLPHETVAARILDEENGRRWYGRIQRLSASRVWIELERGPEVDPDSDSRLLVELHVREESSPLRFPATLRTHTHSGPATCLELDFVFDGSSPLHFSREALATYLAEREHPLRRAG